MALRPIATRNAALDLGLLIAFVIACYGLRMGELSIRGEESRWATVAMEMTRTGDWVVPRQQGEPFLSRPAMGSWLIALAANVRGDCDAVAVRLPSILAVLGTTLVIYGCARSFLGRAGAVGAAAAFASMPEILQMGRLAESDAVFTFFLGGAFIVWLWGFHGRWPDVLTWSLAYALAAGATLTKGPQAPVYFGATVCIYLASTRQWRRLLCWSHLVGLVIYVSIVAAWLVPFWMQLGTADTWRIVTGDSTDRFHGLKWLDIVEHLARYPLELLGCTAPWSWLLIAFASRRFRAGVADLSPQVRFCAIALLVSFPTCWITPGGQTRYMMPLYPCVAILAGVVVDRFALPSPRLRFAMIGLRNVTALTMLGAAAAIVALTWFVDAPGLRYWKQPPWFAALLAVGTMIAAWLWWRAMSIWVARPELAKGVAFCRPTPFASSGRATLQGVLAVASFVGLAYSGVAVNHLCARSEHAAEAIAALKSHLPPDAQLTSLGPTHHKFAYEWRRPIEIIPDGRDVAKQVPPGGYFCYVLVGDVRRQFGFTFEEIAAISMDRHHFDHPQAQVIVCRRVGSSPEPTQFAQRQP